MKVNLVRSTALLAMALPGTTAVAAMVIAIVAGVLVGGTGCGPSTPGSPVSEDHGGAEPFVRVAIDGPARENGAAVWNGCGSCHFTPDPEFPADRAWLGQVPITTCFSFTANLPIAEADQRASLARYLVSTELASTRTFTPDSPPEATGPTGFVRVTDPDAWVVLRATTGSLSEWFRCHWPADSHETAAVALPPGTYIVRHYGLDRQVGDDSWSFSATGVAAERVTVVAGETTTIPLDFSVRCVATATIRPNGLDLGVDMRVNDRQGLTLLLNGRKPVPGWRLIRGHRVIANGVLEYG